MTDTNKDARPIAVVLGGSFNPPTLAHRDLSLHAAGEIQRITGRACAPVLVPSSDAYVRRKMSKQKVHGTVFSEGARLDMCRAMLDGYGGAVDDIEFGDDGRGRTYETMRRLQDAYPEHEYVFLAGADKLKIIPRWHEIEKFLSEFRIAVTARDGARARTMIDADPLLRKYADSFIVIPEMASRYAKASSTEARDRLAYGVNLDDVAELCGYGVTRIIDRERTAGRVDDVSGTAAPGRGRSR